MRIIIALTLFVLSACSKHAVFQSDEAIIVNIRYACGTACDASTYALKIGGHYYVSSEPLLEEYRQHNLPVSVSYISTGRFPVLWEGPTNAEIIDISRIRKR